MHSIYNRKVRDIRVWHLEGCLQGGYVIFDRGKEKGNKRYASACTKARMKSVFNLMFDYALKYDMIKTNYTRKFELGRETAEQKRRDQKPISIFINNEQRLFWEHLGKIKFVDDEIVKKDAAHKENVKECKKIALQEFKIQYGVSRRKESVEEIFRKRKGILWHRQA